MRTEKTLFICSVIVGLIFPVVNTPVLFILDLKHSLTKKKKRVRVQSRSQQKAKELEGGLHSVTAHMLQTCSHKQAADVLLNLL